MRDVGVYEEKSSSQTEIWERWEREEEKVDDASDAGEGTLN